MINILDLPTDILYLIFSQDIAIIDVVDYGSLKMDIIANITCKKINEILFNQKKNITF